MFLLYFVGVVMTAIDASKFRWNMTPLVFPSQLYSDNGIRTNSVETHSKSNLYETKHCNTMLHLYAMDIVAEASNYLKLSLSAQQAKFGSLDISCSHYFDFF